MALGTPESGFLPRQTLDRRAVMGELTAPLAPGPTGRWNRGNVIEVKLYGGALAGEPRLAVLNGANAAAIGTPATGYEVVQFQTAEMTGPGAWRLTDLLRGQAATADVMAAGHASGARLVLLDAAVPPLALSEAESGLALTVRCGPAGAVYDPAIFTDVALTNSRRGLRCYPPVHLAALRDGSGDVTFTWIRQTRIGGDAWETVEVPLGEAAEAYTVSILDGGNVVRVLSVTAPVAVYAGADQIADFGVPPSDIAVRISQVSPTEGPGLAAEETLHV